MMFKNAVLVILCLLIQLTFSRHVLQPLNDAQPDPFTFTELISVNIKREITKCNISISDDVLDLCQQPFLPLRKNSYFNYKQALCITLLDSVERLDRLCTLKKFAKLPSEGSDKVQNVKLFCNKMRSVLNDSLFDTKLLNDQKEWITALKDRLTEEENCKDACIEARNVSNPVCSTLQQIHAHLNVSGKKMPEASDGGETSSRLDGAVQKPPSNVDQEDIRIPEKMPLKVAAQEEGEGYVGDQQQVFPVQEDNPQMLHKDASVKVDLPIKAENKDIFVVPGKVANPKKDTKVSKSEMKHERKLEVKPNSEIKTESMPQSDITTPVGDVNEKNLNAQGISKNAATNKQFSLNTSNVNEPPPPNSHKTNIETASNDFGTMESKNPEVRKPTGETSEHNAKPSQKPEENNKETNEEKPPSDAEDAPGKGISPESPVSENSDVKTVISKVPQDTKAQNSELPKTASDTSSNKVSPPETDAAIEPAQAQSPDTESETGKDPFEPNTFNEEGVEQSIGDNQDGMDLDAPGQGNLPEEDEDMTQKINTLPEIDGMISSPEKGPYVRDKFVNAEDSHFFAYFMTTVIICIIGYLVYHNKQKILALALEGRVRRSSRRRPNTSGYRKLDSNLEEAVTSACSTSVTHVIY